MATPGQSLETPACPTLNHIFAQSVDNVRHPLLLAYRAGGRGRNYSSEEFHQAVFSLCQYFLRAGLKRGDRVAVLSENRPEWHIADFAILLCGLVSVPVYTTFSPAQIKYILEHSRAAAVLVSGERQLQLIAHLVADLRCQAISLSDWELPESSGVSLVRILSGPKPDGEFQKTMLRAALSTDPGALATVVYTSGTTGIPKGVMLTHGNLANNLAECIRRLGFRSVPSALTVLPLAHIFERLLCYGYFQLGVPIAYGDPHDLAELLPVHRPAVMGCVPRILEKIRENVLEQIRSQPPFRQSIAGGLLRIGHARIGDGVFNRRPTVAGRACYPLAHLLLYRKLHKKLGGNLRYMICGGARLHQEVEEFFLSAGIRVLQGYGLTETSPVISLAPFNATKPGTVGKPLENLDIVFGEDGEILVRGPSVFTGYLEDPELTAEACRDGWFRTGDLGRLDSDGYLVISGRKKEMLVTSGGKNVHPAPIEDRLSESPMIRQAFVLGDGRKFIGALIVPEMSKILSVAKSLNVDQPESEVLQRPLVRKAVQEEIDRLLQDFSGPEQVKNFEFLDESALTDPELITPTQKLRRSAMEKKYADRIENIYRISSVPHGQSAAQAGL
jgi:long-chain acyl-CoA synthetase